MTLIRTGFALMTKIISSLISTIEREILWKRMEGMNRRKIIGNILEKPRELSRARSSCQEGLYFVLKSLLLHSKEGDIVFKLNKEKTLISEKNYLLCSHDTPL